MVRPRQYLVVEQHHSKRQYHRREDHRLHKPLHAHAARLERRDLVLRGELREGVQRGDEHRHRERHCQCERHREHHELDDHAPRQPLADQFAKALGDEVEQEQRGQRRQGEDQGPDVLTEDVAGDDLQGDERTWRVIVDAAGRGNRIFHCPSLHGQGGGGAFLPPARAAGLAPTMLPLSG